MKKEEKCAIQENGTKKQSTEEQSPKEYSPLEESTLKRKLQYYSGELNKTRLLCADEASRPHEAFLCLRR